MVWIVEHVLLLSNGESPSTGVLAIALVAVALVAIEARRLAKLGGPACPRQPLIAEGPWAEWVTTALLSMRYVVVSAARFAGSAP